jgi:hypothetical protein
MRLAAAGAQLGILVGVNTNAFWAATTEKASRTLDSIPGITQLMLSTDPYHEEFIPLSNIRNAALAGAERNLEVQIAICTRGGLRDEFVERLVSLIGPDLLTKVRLGVNPTEAVGRALFLPEANWRPQTNVLPEGRCRQINRPVVLEDGTVMACCNTCATAACKDSPLNLGRLEDSSLEEIHARADTSYIIQAIRSLGPKFLADIVIESGAAHLLKPNYARNDICDLCSSMMSNPRTISVLAEAMNYGAKRGAVAVARASQFDELQMLFDMAGQSE